MSDHDDFTDTTRPPDDETSGGSRTWLMIASGVLVLLLAMGVFTIGSALLEDDEPSTGKTASTGKDPEEGEESPDGPEESLCGLEGHEKGGSLTQAPADVTWTLVGRLAVPRSADAGPGVVTDEGVRYCYAHTRAGATLAAAGALAMGLAEDRVEQVKRSIASGPGRSVALATAANAAPPSDASVQIRGFRLVTYTSESALVQLAVDAGGRLSAFNLELLWEDNDWRLRLDPAGEVQDPEPIPDLVGFVPFSGT